MLMRELAPPAGDDDVGALPFAYATAERDVVRVQLLRVMLGDVAPGEVVRRDDAPRREPVPLFGAQWLASTQPEEVAQRLTLHALAAAMDPLVRVARAHAVPLEQIVADVRRLASAVAGAAPHDGHYRAVRALAVQLAMAAYWKAAETGATPDAAAPGEPAAG
jgi:hypothetical protein